MTLPAMTLSSATSAEPRGRPHDDPAAGEALADVVVGVALEPQGDAGRQERAEALPGRPGERVVDGAVVEALGCALVTSWPSIVPTVRLTLRIGNRAGPRRRGRWRRGRRR